MIGNDALAAKRRHSPCPKVSPLRGYEPNSLSILGLTPQATLFRRSAADKSTDHLPQRGRESARGLKNDFRVASCLVYGECFDQFSPMQYKYSSPRRYMNLPSKKGEV